MKYIFLEKNSVENPDPLIKDYFYFITEDKDLIFANVPEEDKVAISFNFESLKPISFTHHSPPKLESVFGDMFLDIVHKELLEVKVLKFIVNDNDKNNIKIEKVESLLI